MLYYFSIALGMCHRYLADLNWKRSCTNSHFLLLFPCKTVGLLYPVWVKINICLWAFRADQIPLQKKAIFLIQILLWFKRQQKKVW